MISKMNYLLLSTMMVAAIDSTFGSCCPCAKENVEEGGKDDFGTLLPNIENNTTPVKEELSQKKKEKVEDGEEDDFETKIISSHDNDKKDDVKAQGSNDEFTNPVIGQNATDKYTNVKMGSTSSDGNLKNDGQKNDIKPKVEYDVKIKRTLYTMKVRHMLCHTNGCGNGKIVHLNVIAVNETNATKETGINLQLCEQHNGCYFEECKNKPEYLLQCGHMFCSSHYRDKAHPTLCKECGITLCGCMRVEYNHQPCGTSVFNMHYLCNKNRKLGPPKLYHYGQHCKKHRQTCGPDKEHFQRVYTDLVSRKGNLH